MSLQQAKGFEFFLTASDLELASDLTRARGTSVAR